MDREVFDRMERGEWITDHRLKEDFIEAADRAFLLRQKLNTCPSPDMVGPILEEILGYPVPEKVTVIPPLHFDAGFNIRLGHHVLINYGCVLLDNAPITIGNHVLLGPGVQVITVVHPLIPEERNVEFPTSSAEPVTIEDDVWIGAGAIILPGIRIGKGAVVGAGSVVTRDVEPGTVVVGNPARFLRKIGPEDSVLKDF